MKRTLEGSGLSDRDIMLRLYSLRADKNVRHSSGQVVQMFTEKVKAMGSMLRGISYWLYLFIDLYLFSMDYSLLIIRSDGYIARSV
jgi:hypothetical protein